MKLAIILMLLSSGVFASHLDVSIIKSTRDVDNEQKRTYNEGSSVRKGLKFRSVLDIQKEASVILGLETGHVNGDNLRYKSRNDKNVNFNEHSSKYTTFEIGLRLKF